MAHHYVPFAEFLGQVLQAWISQLKRCGISGKHLVEFVEQFLRDGLVVEVRVIVYND